MTDHMPDDLSAAGREVRSFTDEKRAQHAIVCNAAGEWVLLRHEHVTAAACDDVTFSSAVSRHLQVPNGLDGDEHSVFRTLVDSYFTQAALAPYVPLFEQVAADLVAELPRGRPVDAVTQIGALFAVRAQCGWLGWPADLEQRLLSWMHENHAATRSGDYTWTSQVAADFDDIIRSVVTPREQAIAAGHEPPHDLTTQLVRSRVQGRPVREEEVVSMLRNWTGGDLGSLALCVGVVLHDLATQPEHLAAVSSAHDSGDDESVDAILEEMLRIDNPFVSNRRITTCPVRIAGQDLPAGARIKLHWTSANRDESVFGADPSAFDPVGNAAANLVYGIGRHVCPGRPLARIQLRALVHALLTHTSGLRLDPAQEPEREISPVGGYRSVPVIID